MISFKRWTLAYDIGVSSLFTFPLLPMDRKSGLSRSSSARALLPLLAILGLFSDSIMFFYEFWVSSEVRRPWISDPTLDVVLFRAARAAFLLSVEERITF